MAALGSDAGPELAEGSVAEQQVPAPHAPEGEEHSKPIHSGQSASAPQSGAQDDETHERFSGLRIINRCVTHEQVAGQVQGGRVVRFSRVPELGRKENANRIVIGVLCEWFPSRFGNGEVHMQLILTDMAEPQPRQLKVHVRGRAYAHWSKAASKTLTRKSIFALMNPVLLDAGSVSKNIVPAVSVENPAQLGRLGDCPSLGLCDMKGCKNPCNIDLKDRFCKMHLSLVLANKGGRCVTGGLDRSVQNPTSGAKRKLPTLRQEKHDDEEEQDPELVESAKRQKSAIALKFDDRRFISSAANDDYFRSIREGRKATDASTSRVPMLGRSLDQEKGIEIDMATLETREKFKTERLIDVMVEKRAERMVARDTLEPPQPSAVVRKQAAPKGVRDPPAAKEKNHKRVLGDLLEKFKGTHAARRTGNKSSGANDVKKASSRSGSQNASLSTADDSAGNESRASANLSPEDEMVSAVNLLRDLENAGEDAARIKHVLTAADSLPISVLEGVEGGKFYAAVGRLTMHAKSLEIRREALCARRRWRAASDDAIEAARKKVAAELVSAANDAMHEDPSSIQTSELPSGEELTSHTTSEILLALPPDARPAQRSPVDMCEEAHRNASDCQGGEALLVEDTTSQMHVQTSPCIASLAVDGNSSLPTCHDHIDTTPSVDTRLSVPSHVCAPSLQGEASNPCASSMSVSPLEPPVGTSIRHSSDAATDDTSTHLGGDLVVDAPSFPSKSSTDNAELCSEACSGSALPSAGPGGA